MRLENILALTNGVLKNDPFVKNFDNIVFNLKDLKRGDLFVAFDEEMIQEAVSAGAYGVLYDTVAQVSDEEIAWIQVDSCEDALLRLLRFRLIEKDVRTYTCNEIVLKLALQVQTDSNCIVVHGNVQEIYKQLWNLQDKATLLFCPQLCNPSIFTDVKELIVSEVEAIEIMEQTLFETSFIYENIFYERQLISPFFIPYLEELLHLYKSLKINFKLKKFTAIKHFEAVFTNKNFEEKEFGASDKVLIFEPNSSLIDVEISFLQKNASWAKLIYILPHSIDGIEDKNIFIYKNKNKIIDILKSQDFHFALIVGVDKEILSKPIVNQAQLTLDFK
jgi:ferrochelatase